MASPMTKNTEPPLTFDAAVKEEALFGISSFASQNVSQSGTSTKVEGFEGVLKARFTDFIVKEVGIDGTIATLEDIPYEDGRKAAMEGDNASSSSLTPVAPKTFLERCAAAAEDVGKLCNRGDKKLTVGIKTELLKFLVENEPGKEEGKGEEKVEEKGGEKGKGKEEEKGEGKEEVKKAPIFTLPRVSDKSNRGMIHSKVRLHLSSYFITDTDEGCVRVIPEAFADSANTYGSRPGDKGKGGKRGNDRGGKGGGNKKRRKLNDGDFWPPSRGDYLQFVLYKENVDTMSAVKDLERRLKCKSGGKKGIAYGGTKDKRAVTGQFVTVYRKEKDDVEWVNGQDKQNAIYGGGGSGSGGYVNTVRVGRFKFVREHIGLGMLRGNRFTIVLRNVKKLQGEGGSLKDVVDRRCKGVMDKGFVNYFGMQRFGKFLDTHKVGIHMMKGDFEAAVDVIMSVKSGGGGERENIIKAREVWGKREKDKEGCETAAKESLKGMGYMRGPEKTVMEYLSKNSEDYKGALFAIQKGMRLMYLHAMQSLIWNIVASKRWEKGGGDVMVGDLVVEEERDKSVKHSQRSNKKVLEVTAENISGYTMKDVVISLPGSKVVVPSVYVGLYADACREIGLLGEGVEMDMKALFSSTVKDFNLGGDYRRILGEARDMDCEVLEYAREEPKVPLVETDLMRMEGVKLPQTVKEIGEEGKGKLAGVRVSFELPASSYATIVIREITGMPQIQGYLRGLELE